MESACVVVVVCVLSCCFGLVQNSTFCKQKFGQARYHKVYVNVCQDDSASLETYEDGDLILDAATAPLQQDIACRCYLSPVHTMQYIKVGLRIDVDGDQNVSFAVDGKVFGKSHRSGMNITTGVNITYQHSKQDHHPRVCMAIQKWADTRGKLTLHCQRLAVPTTDRPLTTTSTTDTTTTLTPTAQTEEKGSTNAWIGIVAGAVVGAVVVLAGIVTIIVFVLRRKCRNSETQPEQGVSTVAFHDSENDHAEVIFHELLQDDQQDGHNYQADMPGVAAPTDASLGDVHLYDEPRQEFENARLNTYEPLQSARGDDHDYQAVVPDSANSEYEDPLTGEQHDYINVR